MQWLLAHLPRSHISPGMGSGHCLSSNDLFLLLDDSTTMATPSEQKVTDSTTSKMISFSQLCTLQEVEPAVKLVLARAHQI